MDFYESKGWRVGSSAMKDWKAAVRTWEQRRRNAPQGAVRTADTFRAAEQSDLEQLKEIL